MLDIKNEIQFWTEIMLDHAEFQLNHLSPLETEAISSAEYFIKTFKELNQNARDKKRQEDDMVASNLAAVGQFVKFKKVLLSDLMICKVKLNMTPSFLNHMINEAMEYYRVLNINNKTIPPIEVSLETIRLHKVWLSDTSGHAKFIYSQLDDIEALYINEAFNFERRFDELCKKAQEMYQMYERTNVNNHSLGQFNHEVELEMNNFMNFLEFLKKMRSECIGFASGTFGAPTLNHMLEEAKYYLSKVKELYPEVKKTVQ